MNVRTGSPGIKGSGGDSLFPAIFLSVKVTMMMKDAILLSKITVISI